MDAALWGFLGTIIGAGASIATSWISNRHELMRQKQSDSLVRVERARAFQRDNLLELQQTVQDAMRFSARIMHEDSMAFKQSGKWGTTLLGEEVSEGSRAANARLMALTVRVADDEVRDAINNLRNMLTSCQLAKSKEHADIVHKDIAEAYPLLMERIGKTLRSLY
ncbi:hypothetical protein GALL_03580 [mine drainage metagenome]|uniref:Uncharacterized protein n=1 Tax=mine drainage metagenome TaxID=410659 RepID=A0A1J5TSX1_9ZZZZ